MEIPVTLWLTEDESAALDLEAAAYNVAPEVRVRTWIAPLLSESMRRHEATQWGQRKRTLSTDATLAAQVDAAGRR